MAAFLIYRLFAYQMLAPKLLVRSIGINTNILLFRIWLIDMNGMRQGNYPLGTYFTLYCCATQSQRLNSIPETNVSVARRSQSLFQWFTLSTTGRLHVLRVQVPVHYYDVIMGAMASQITNLTMVYSTVHSGPDQRKHQSSASLAFVTGEFPAKIAISAEDVSIWWRHHVCACI